jgi:hypothetical protein
MQSLFGLALVALAGVGLLYGERQRQARMEEKADHAKCIAHIASATSNRVIAMALRERAEKWDSIENQADLRRLANERYSPGGPSMPTIWLREEADLIDPLGSLDRDRIDMEPTL